MLYHKKQRLTTTFPPDQWDSIVDTARRENISLAEAVRRLVDKAINGQEGKVVDFVFDGDHATGLTFVETELPDGSGVGVGNWYKRHDGYWCLRVRIVE